MFPSRVMIVDTDLTWMEGVGRNGYYETPPVALRSISDLVQSAVQAARAVQASDITVVLEKDATTVLGFPKKVPTNEKTVKEHRLLKQLRGDNWRVSGLSPWITVWMPNWPAVHIGVGPWLHEGNNELHADDPGNMAYRLASFQRITGAAFHGNPGLPALQVLKSMPRPVDPQTRKPLRVEWTPRWDGCIPALSDCERDFAKWINPEPQGGSFRIGYDATRQFLAAASNTLVTVDALRRTGNRPFNKSVSGYWKIKAPAWNVPGLPNPSGYETGAECWVTTPTLELLEELDTAGYLAFPDILESWTCDENVRQFFRPWVTRLNDAYERSTLDTTLDGKAVTAAVKGMYKVGIGLMSATTGRSVCRPDWRHAIIAKARCNIFRKMFAVWLQMGIAPTEISYDKIWYSATHSNWDAMRRDRNNKISEAFPIGDNLGSFTREVKAA